jgi:O-antigen/teichoic acid export membrane protein
MFRRVADRIRDGIATAQVQRALVLGRQGVWSSAEYLFYPLIMLAATPAFLHSLGAEQYGQWMLLITLGGLGGWAGLGMGAATTREVAAARARGDHAAVLQTIRVALFIVIFCSIGAGLLLIAGFLSGGDELLSRMGGFDQLLPVVAGAALMLLADQVDSVYVGALRGSERFDLAARLEILSRFVIVGGCLAAASLSGRLDLVIIANVVLNIGRVLAKGAVVSRLLRAGAVAPAWDRRRASALVRFGKWSFLQLVGSAFFATADRLIVGSVLGADALARYSICLQLAQQVQNIPAAFGSFLFPYFTKAVELADGGSIRRSLTVATWGLTVFALCLAAPVVLFAKPILEIWVGADIASQGAGLLQVLAIAHCGLAVSVAAHYFLYGSGRAQSVAVGNLMAGAVSVAVNITLIPVLGLTGAAVSRIAYAVILALCYAWVLLR